MNGKRAFLICVLNIFHCFLAVFVYVFLFNLGYFIPSSHQYITFLSYADYFEGTMPFIVIHVILATFVFTQPFTWLPKLVEDFEVYIKASRKKIVYTKLYTKR